MATKFKSRFTAEMVETLLESVESAKLGAIIKVDELPEPSQANGASFYLYEGKLHFSDGKEWAVVGSFNEEISTGTPVNPDEGVIGGSIVIEDEEGEVVEEIVPQIFFSDFAQYDDEYHFTLIKNSQTDKYIHALIEQMSAQDKTYFTLTKAEAYGFIEDEKENNLLNVTIASNYGHFFIKMDLIDGHEVDITLEEVLADGTELYLIEYVGYVL
jgi:hypothetical protein